MIFDILKKSFRDLFLVLLPKYCLGCGSVLPFSQNFACTSCRCELSQTHFSSLKNNEFEKLFAQYELTKKATSLLYFMKGNITQKLIHQLKYKGNQEIGAWLGDWLGQNMADSGRFSDMDIVIPVPLHKKRLKKRGYNQVSEFGKNIAKHLQIPYIENELIRHKASKSQTQKNHKKRFDSVKNSFRIKNNSIFAQRNILLVDDVVTTGATLKACYSALEEGNPRTINFATISFAV